MSWPQAKAVRARVQTLIRAIYPPQCLDCGCSVESEFGLCGACWAATPFIGGALCGFCGAQQLGPVDPGDAGHAIACDDCMAHPRPWGEARAALQYARGGRRLVLRLKHADRTDVARPAARWMAQIGARLLGPGVLLVPVPLHWTRLMARRYNQAALLAQAIGQLSGCAVCPDLLRRVKRTPSLGQRGAAERAAVLAGSIALNPRRRARLEGARIVLVDDVMASGATLSACTKVCLDGGARQVNVLLLARASKEP